MIIPVKGTVFVHNHFLDDDRQLARMKVTAVRNGTVHYTYAGEPSNRGAFKMPVENWQRKYGGQQ